MQIRVDCAATGDWQWWIEMHIAEGRKLSTPVHDGRTNEVVTQLGSAKTSAMKQRECNNKQNKKRLKASSLVSIVPRKPSQPIHIIGGSLACGALLCALCARSNRSLSRVYFQHCTCPCACTRERIVRRSVVVVVVVGGVVAHKKNALRGCPARVRHAHIIITSIHFMLMKRARAHIFSRWYAHTYVCGSCTCSRAIENI